MESPSVPQFQELLPDPVNTHIFCVKFSLAVLEAFVPPQHAARVRNLQVGKHVCPTAQSPGVEDFFGRGEGIGQNEEADVV